jgi:ABC-type nitrate/sulfonate/bicarbonate transport system permease component
MPGKTKSAGMQQHESDPYGSALFQNELFRALVGITLFLILWYVLTAVLDLPRFKLLPNPVSVVKEWVSFTPLSGRSIFKVDYYWDIAYSVARTLIAFSLATAMGVSLGLLMGWSRIFYELLPCGTLPRFEA